MKPSFDHFFRNGNGHSVSPTVRTTNEGILVCCPHGLKHPDPAVALCEVGQLGALRVPGRADLLVDPPVARVLYGYTQLGSPSGLDGLTLYLMLSSELLPSQPISALLPRLIDVLHQRLGLAPGSLFSAAGDQCYRRELSVACYCSRQFHIAANEVSDQDLVVAEDLLWREPGHLGAALTLFGAGVLRNRSHESPLSRRVRFALATYRARIHVALEHLKVFGRAQDVTLRSRLAWVGNRLAACVRHLSGPALQPPPGAADSVSRNVPVD